MKVFRLCNKEEINRISEGVDYKLLSKKYQTASIKNTHQYDSEKRYMHFFKDEISILFLSPRKGKFICEYDIPDTILDEYKGYGNYADFIHFSKILKVPEFAIPSEKMKVGFLKRIYLINKDLDFDYIPEKAEISDCLSCVVDLSKRKEQYEEDRDL